MANPGIAPTDIPFLFKRKARELAGKLAERFPGQLPLVLPAIDAADEDELFSNYYELVHIPYGHKIKERDEDFFMTSDSIADPMQLIGMLRGLWKQMDSQDQEAVWRYLGVFEKLCIASRPQHATS